MRMQSGRRSRSRSRKGPNPLTKSYESNGPDVKIRGNAAHIAEKYGQLARDALASGDTVTAENYLQHAEHYNRIIAAAQAQSQAQQPERTDGRDDARDEARDEGAEVQSNDAQAEATSNGEAAETTVEAPPTEDVAANGNSRPAPRRRRRKPTPEAEVPAIADTSPVSTGGATVYPADQPQPEIDEPA